ncbi:MAG: SpoIID/LytB domain-containing protein [Candidatus Omnitrophota bacterium]|jgi:stage II sporulation protein D
MVSPLKNRLDKFKKPIIGIALFVSCQLLAASGYAETPRYVRVAIVQDSVSIRLKIRGFYEVVDAYSRKAIFRGKNINTTVTADKEGILLGNLKARSNKVSLQADDPEAIIINGRRFRGNIRLIKKDNLRLLVINYLDLEDYIKGILYHEVSHYWPMEALKAQAIVSRTYAVYQTQENRAKDYDVTCDIYSQVYGGKTSERYRTNKAVAGTEGRVMVYKGKVFPAYFHATCAGHTEDASLLWNINLPPLKGVVCNFCQESPHFRWHQVLSLEELGEKLREAGKKIDRIKSIIILGRDNSGRITDLKIASDKNELEISAKDFRNVIGPNIIRSANFNISVVNSDAVFEGKGWGHGVGLCQWGAYFMAKAGRRYDEILKYYYPGAQVQ